VSLLAVDAALMREVLLPGLTLSVGRAVAARVVAADTGEGGKLAIAGFLIDAELPAELATGDTVRLEVRDVDSQRVLLAVAGHDTPSAPQPPPPDGVALPGGGWLKVTKDGEGDGGSGRGGGSGAQTLGLQLQLPRLGTVELRFELDAAALRAVVGLAAGEPFMRAQEQAPALREALTGAAQRPATVTVVPRREPVDVYA
jgi:hypothetical protein